MADLSDIKEWAGVTLQRLRLPAILSLLLLAVLVSSVGVVYSTHLTRQNFSELQQLKRQENELDIEWNQLLLEHSARSSQHLIEQVGRDKLQMIEPDASNTVMVSP